MKSLAAFFSELTTSKKLLLLLAPTLSILASMKIILLGLWLLIFIDLLTGIRKSLHQKGLKFNPFKTYFWKSIKSYLLRKTWVKTYEYGIGIITIVILESLILGQTDIELAGKIFTISQLSAALPACVEVWSIFENFEAVSGNNILKKVMKYAKDRILKRLLGKSSFSVSDNSKEEEPQEGLDL